MKPKGSEYKGEDTHLIIHIFSRTFHKRSTAGEEEEEKKEEYEGGSGWKGEDKEVWKEDMELLEYIEGTDKEEIFETGRNQVITVSCKMQEDKSWKIF